MTDPQSRTEPPELADLKRKCARLEASQRQLVRRVDELLVIVRDILVERGNSAALGQLETTERVQT